MRRLAEQAKATGADTATATFFFIGDDEPVDAEYVPVMSVGIRRPPAD
jgi:hypothetical protein